MRIFCPAMMASRSFSRTAAVLTASWPVTPVHAVGCVAGTHIPVPSTESLGMAGGPVLRAPPAAGRPAHDEPAAPTGNLSRMPHACVAIQNDLGDQLARQPPTSGSRCRSAPGSRCLLDDLGDLPR